MKKIILLMAIMAITTTKFSFAQVTAQKAFNPLLTAYFDLKNALAKDQSKLAIEKAKTFSTKLAAIPHKELPAAEHTLWMEQSKMMQLKTDELINGKDLKVQRKSFEGLSSAMLKVVRNIKFNHEKVYVQYCPMAKASWLNEKENIENPYYGSMMFDCGEVRETIPAK